MSRQAATQRALAGLRNAFMEAGQSPASALHLARVILTRPNVQIGPRGNIRWNGRVYSPATFATSNLAKTATGAVARARNQAAITGDPGYIQTLAELALQRDQAEAGLGDTRRQQLIQFGDPSLVQGDPLTAGAAQANPFSTTALLALQNQRNQMAVRGAANRYGTYYGGGLQSGMAEQGRVNAGAYQDAYTKLQNLLASLNSQQALAEQGYGVGQKGAYLDAYNRLLASGAIHAAHAPAWSPGGYHYIGFPAPGGPQVGGGGGVQAMPGGHAPGPGSPSPSPPTYINRYPIPTAPRLY